MRKQNVTLTIDPAVLKAARKYALDRDTSVNQLVRDYLAGLAGPTDELEAARNDLRKFFRKSRYQIGQRRWTREELYDRR
ncbi:MAG TPA: DUF6364 family protein [Bryobacteraceae bacterium]|nr:DUF6364 family protein [Bryobacteraceae bacterium]